MMDRMRKLVDRASDTRRHLGTGAVARLAMNRLLVQAHLDLVHVLLLEPGKMRVPEVDRAFETRFLSLQEVRRFAADPTNRMGPEFVGRAEGGLDHCFATLHGDRLANYGWYALQCVEPEHAAGTALRLPPDVAYLYKAFTHPDYRGQRLHAASMGRALDALRDRGVGRLVSYVYWSNVAALHSCDRLGWERLGLLVVGPRNPLHVPARALRLGMAFGGAAEEALSARSTAPAVPTRPTPSGA